VGLQKAVVGKFGFKPKISTGSRGDMTVLVNGTNVFNYKKEGAMPPTDELLQRIAAYQQAG
jgi:predicted Rdx family selenoprotein